jgi:hypothetical protein
VGAAVSPAAAGVVEAAVGAAAVASARSALCGEPETRDRRLGHGHRFP